MWLSQKDAARAAELEKVPEKQNAGRKDMKQEAEESSPLRKLGWNTKKCMLCNALRSEPAKALFSDKKGYGFCLDCGKNADTFVLTNENLKRGIQASAATGELIKKHLESIQSLFPPNWKDNEVDRAKGLLILGGFLGWRDWEKTWGQAIILGLKESDINR